LHIKSKFNSDLSMKGVKGTIEGVEKLSSLTGLILSYNKLTGPIPNLNKIGNLREL